MAPRTCCQVAQNRQSVPHDHPDETLEVCRVCGAKHYECHAQPGVLGLRGTPVGVQPLTPQEWQEISRCVQAVQLAEQAKASCVRRILESRGLDTAAVYDFCPDGTIRQHEKVTVN